MIRCRIPELMDAPSLDREAHAHALRTLNRVNRMLGVDRRLYQSMRQLSGSASMSILDLGTGGGGFLGYLAERRHNNADHALVGIDKSRVALGLAQRWYGQVIRWLPADARNIPLGDDSIDIVTCSLFLHHFGEADAVLVLREAARVARLGIVIDDLSRSTWAFVLTWLATRILSRSRVFQVDGPRSVRAAFCPKELCRVARRAGLDGARVEKRCPFRLLIVWKKPETQSA